jgi:hypothetical protein
MHEALLPVEKLLVKSGLGRVFKTPNPQFWGLQNGSKSPTIGGFRGQKPSATLIFHECSEDFEKETSRYV